MAQVEFVAVIATIFKNYAVEPVPRPGETLEATRRRLLDVLEDSITRVTLQIKRPEEVKLSWIPRNKVQT